MLRKENQTGVKEVNDKAASYFNYLIKPALKGAKCANKHKHDILIKFHATKDRTMGYEIITCCEDFEKTCRERIMNYGRPSAD